MGIRTTQLMGLTYDANEIIRQNRVILWTDNICRKHANGDIEHLETHKYDIPRRASGNKWVGMFEEEGDLMIYTLLDGREVEEYIQAQPWSSGPCIFLALRDAKTKEPLPETLWDEGSINGV